MSWSSSLSLNCLCLHTGSNSEGEGVWGQSAIVPARSKNIKKKVFDFVCETSMDSSAVAVKLYCCLHKADQKTKYCCLEHSVENPRAEEAGVYLYEFLFRQFLKLYAWQEHLVQGIKLNLVWFHLSHFLFNHPASQFETVF